MIKIDLELSKIIETLKILKLESYNLIFRIVYIIIIIFIFIIVDDVSTDSHIYDLSIGRLWFYGFSCILIFIFS